MTDQATAKLQRLVYRNKPSVTAIDGPQEGVIVSADTEAGTCFCTVTKVGGATYAYGPLPYPTGGLTPIAGMRCLVVFVGAGVGDGWVIGLTNAPKPDGY